MSTIEEQVLMLEKRAMTGDRDAVLLLVSSFRKLRRAAKNLLERRYGDGECDAVALGRFSDELEESITDLLEEEP